MPTEPETAAPKVETYRNAVINYAWFLQVSREGGGCRILLHDRRRFNDPSCPPAVGTFRLLEDNPSSRTVLRAQLIRPDGTHEALDVVNPGHIFSYPKFPTP